MNSSGQKLPVPFSQEVYMSAFNDEKASVYRTSILLYKLWDSISCFLWEVKHARGLWCWAMFMCELDSEMNPTYSPSSVKTDI